MRSPTHPFNTMQIERKYLSHKEQVKVQFLQDECLMLSLRIARIVKKRDRLMRKRDKILDRGLET
mgnify:CR=1 FL=1|jgi:hypothetical protein